MKQFVIVGVLAAVAAAPAASQAARWADDFAKAVRKLNEGHARKPGKTTEDELARRLPKPARAALDRLLGAERGDGLADALVAAGEAALDLALVKEFNQVRERLLKLAPDSAEELGTVLVRPRFLLRGLGGIGEKYLAHFAEVLDAVLDSYDRVFGFAEFSKIPGKRIRVRVRLVEKIERPPYFDPSRPFHSAIDFPVSDPEELASPTADGKFLFYGLCHELGHLVVMWGDRRNMADHHAWAHFTGVVICEALSESGKKKRFMKKLRDVRWRSLEKERREHEKVAPSLDDRAGVLALLVQLHDGVGPKAIGAALNLMDTRGMGHRINHVRYYSFADLEKALLKVVKGRKAVATVKRLLK